MASTYNIIRRKVELPPAEYVELKLSVQRFREVVYAMGETFTENDSDRIWFENILKEINK